MKAIEALKKLRFNSILLLMLFISLLISPQLSRAAILINNIPADISVTEGQPLDIPLFIGAEELTGKDIELFIWKENLDGSGKAYFKDGNWINFSQPSDIRPLFQFGPMIEYFYAFWQAFDNTQGLKSFLINICIDGEIDSQLTSSSLMCGKRNIIINPPVNNCSGLYLSQSSITQTVEKGKSVTVDITIKDSCGNPIDFSATKTQAWLTLTNQKGLLRATIQTTNLLAGTYTDTIRVTSGGETKSITVTLTVKNTTITFPFPIGSCTPTSINPYPISITAAAGEQKTQSVNITNNCGGSVTYTAQVISGSNWLSASSSGTGTMNVTVKTSGLSAGQYTGQVKITSGSLTGTLDVTLTVTGPCEPGSAVIDPISITRSIQVGQSLSPITVSVKDNCGNSLGYTVNSVTVNSVSGSWITAPTQGATGTGSLTLNFSTSNLQVGSYSGSINLTPNGYSPMTISISLTVSATPPPSTGGNLTKLIDNTRYRFKLGPRQYRLFYFNTASLDPTNPYDPDLNDKSYLEVRLEGVYNIYPDGRYQRGDAIVKYMGQTCNDTPPSLDDLNRIKNGESIPNIYHNLKTIDYLNAFELIFITGSLINAPHYPLGCYYILVYNDDTTQTSDLYIRFVEPNANSGNPPYSGEFGYPVVYTY